MCCREGEISCIISSGSVFQYVLCVQFPQISNFNIFDDDAFVMFVLHLCYMCLYTFCVCVCVHARACSASVSACFEKVSQF